MCSVSSDGPVKISSFTHLSRQYLLSNILQSDLSYISRGLCFSCRCVFKRKSLITTFQICIFKTWISELHCLRPRWWLGGHVGSSTRLLVDCVWDCVCVDDALRLSAKMAPFPDEVDVFTGPHWRMKQLVGSYCEKVNTNDRPWLTCSLQRDIWRVWPTDEWTPHSALAS